MMKNTVIDYKNLRNGLECKVMIDIAIKAMEEVQEYRKIGTVEELKATQKYIELVKKHGTIGKVIDACAEYESIGTITEAQEAVEKQKAKKPDYEGDGYADGHMVYDIWICPNCGDKYEIDYEQYDYCPYCGQKIDWSNENE